MKDIFFKIIQFVSGFIPIVTVIAYAFAMTALGTIFILGLLSFL